MSMFADPHHAMPFFSLPLGSTRPRLVQNAISVLPIVARRSLALRKVMSTQPIGLLHGPQSLVWFLGTASPAATDSLNLHS